MNNKAIMGGGLFINIFYNAKFNNSTFISNIASKEGGAIYTLRGIGGLDESS